MPGIPMSRREVLRWLSLSALAPALAGCSLFRPKSAAAPTKPAPTPVPAATVEKPELLYARPAGQEFGLLAGLIAEFNQRGLAPDVVVRDVQLQGDPAEQLMHLAAGGTPVDVHAMADELIPELAGQGYLLALDPFLQADASFDVGDFYEQYLVNARYGGQLWALPWTAVGYIMFVDLDYLDAAGVAAPSGDWSWDDFRMAGLELTDPENLHWACGRLSWTEMTERLWQGGAEAFSTDRTQCLLGSPEAMDILEYWAGLVLSDEITPGPTDIPAQGNYDLFRSGRVAMYEDMVAMVQSHKEAGFRWNVAYLPYASEKVNLLVSGSQVISAATQHREEAWTLLKFLTGTDAMIAWSTAMRLPTARKSANAQRPYIDPTIDIDWDLVQMGVDYGRLPYAIPQSAQVTDLLNGMLREIFAGVKTVPQAVEETVPKVDALIGAGFGG